jgi:hypothetical protein
VGQSVLSTGLLSNVQKEAEEPTHIISPSDRE